MTPTSNASARSPSSRARDRVGSRRRTRHGASFVYLAGAVTFSAPLACSGGGYEETLVDTTGVRIQRSCTETDCEYTFLDDPGCGDGSPSLIGSRHIHVCSGSETAVFIENCRAITCTEDKTCDIFASPFECRGGLCERVEWPVAYDGGERDVVSACFADVPRSETCRLSVFPASPNPATVIIDENCAEQECSIPDECTAR